MLAVLLVSLCSYSYCNEVKLTSPNQTTVSDDHYAEVPLQFVFPFYGEEFETSYMFTNGVVGFRNPTDQEVESHWCCQGRDLAKMAEDGTLNKCVNCDKIDLFKQFSQHDVCLSFHGLYINIDSQPNLILYYAISGSRLLACFRSHGCLFRFYQFLK